MLSPLCYTMGKQVRGLFCYQLLYRVSAVLVICEETSVFGIWTLCQGLRPLFFSLMLLEGVSMLMPKDGVCKGEKMELCIWASARLCLVCPPELLSDVHPFIMKT